MRQLGAPFWDKKHQMSTNAVQEGKENEDLELVSSQFRKQRLAVWAAGRVPQGQNLSALW